MIFFLKRFSVAACLALSLVLFAGSAAAQDSPVLDRVVKSGQLRVGMSGSQPPFNVVSRDGSLIGLEVDLANMLASGLRVDLKIVQKPFGDLLGELAAGNVDVVMSGMAITPQRSQTVSFAGPYMMAGKSILTRSDVLAGADDAGDVNSEDITLAALENSTSQQFAEKVMPRSKLVKVKNYDDAVKMLLDGKVDALVADMPICVLTILRNPNAGLSTLSQPFTVEPIGIAMAAGDTQMLNLVESYVAAMEKMGALDLMRKKWLQDSSWIAALP
jgi:polar amino acid transport system substrate-binding protein